MDDKVKALFDAQPLAEIEDYEPTVYCEIDVDDRTISIPDEYTLAGVEADNNVKRIFFRCNKISQITDLSTFTVYINYMNANGEADRHICDDVEIKDNELYFSWLISDFATAYRGNVRFIVCMIDDTNSLHWNTTIATIEVLEGLETSATIVEQNPDVIENMLLKLQDHETRIRNLETGGGGGGTGGTVSVRVGSTTTGEPGTDAKVTNSGTEQNVVLNFVIPRGQKGDTGAKGEKGDKGDKGETGADGKAATIRVGSVTTGDTAKVTNSGTETDAVFDFVIPQGGSGKTKPEYNFYTTDNPYYVPDLMGKTSAEIYELFEEYVTDGVITKELIGYASQATSSTPTGEATDDTTKPIYLYKLNKKISRAQIDISSDNTNGAILITCAMHGNEKTPVVAMLNLCEEARRGSNPFVNKILSNMSIQFVAICNPGGFDTAATATLQQIKENSTGRVNPRGVNINRNARVGWQTQGGGSTQWGNNSYKGPFALSESETKALKVVEIDRASSWMFNLDLHCTQGDVVFQAFGENEMCALGTDVMAEMYSYMIEKYGVDLGEHYSEDYPATQALTVSGNPQGDWVTTRQYIHKRLTVEFKKFSEDPNDILTKDMQAYCAEYVMNVLYKLVGYLKINGQRDYDQRRMFFNIEQANGNLIDFSSIPFINGVFNEADGSIRQEYIDGTRLITKDWIELEEGKSYELSIASTYSAPTWVNYGYQKEDGTCDVGNFIQPGQTAQIPSEAKRVKIWMAFGKEKGGEARADYLGWFYYPVLKEVPKATGGGDVPSDYDTVRNNSEKAWIDKTLTYTIASNKEDIFDAVENSKADKMQITDGSEYWDADENAKYPSVLSVKQLRNNRFYANMWLPNNLDMEQDYRYNVDKNGQIRLYNINGQKSDLTSLSPWGICLRAEGKSFPTTAIHFILSTFKILGLHSVTGKWEVIRNAKPIASLFDIAHTSTDGHVIDVQRTDLGNDMFSFAINNASNWQVDGEDMCFHFFLEQSAVITKEDVANYDKIIVSFNLKVQESQYADVFTCSAGCDALGSSTSVEAFFSRFNAVTDRLLEYNANNCLESESQLISDQMLYIDAILQGGTGSSTGGGGTDPGGGNSHTELARIGIDNNCYFNTEIYPDATANIELKVHVNDPDISGTWVAGARDTNNKYTLSITDNWYVTRGSVSSEAKKTAFLETDWTIIQDGADFTFNKTTVSCDAISDLTINANYYIGNCNNNGEPYTGKGFNGTFYYAKLKSDQKLVADIIPVKKSDGTICLYDKVRKKYLYNKGTGKLTQM